MPRNIGTVRLWRRREETTDAAAAPVAEVQEFPTAKPHYPTTSGWEVPVHGIHDQPVDRKTALTVPAIRRGVNLLAVTVASLPWQRIGADGTKKPLGWLAQPEAGRPLFQTLKDTLYDLQFDNVAYWKVNQRTATGEPAPGGVEYVSLDRIKDNRKTGGVFEIDGREVRSLANIIGFEGWHGDGGILTAGARTIRIALALEAAAKRYADTPQSSVDLVNDSSYTLTDDEIDDLVRNYKRTRNAEAVGFVDKGLRVEKNGWSSKELQLIEARQYLNTLIANLIGLPADAIPGASALSGGSLTYSTTAQEARKLIDYGLVGPINSIETRLSMTDQQGNAWTNQVTPRGDVIRANLDARLRGNPIDRAQLYQILVPLGVLTVEEARAMEDLTPIGGTDV